MTFINYPPFKMHDKDVKLAKSLTSFNTANLRATNFSSVQETGSRGSQSLRESSTRRMGPRLASTGSSTTARPSWGSPANCLPRKLECANCKFPFLLRRINSNALWLQTNLDRKNFLMKFIKKKSK